MQTKMFRGGSGEGRLLVGGLTVAHVRRRVAAGRAGGLLDVVRPLATAPAQSVRLVVALTERSSTLAYHLHE